MNTIELSLFVSRMEAVCDEMGIVLKRTAFSPNIKDRLDFSCALFDVRGELCAQAAHIPVHLGSMAFAMGGIVNQFSWNEGDVLVLNDPFLGGTHLPDVTVVAPVFANKQLMAFVVNRAHHANIGSDSPGSMPNSSTLEEEGLIISPEFLLKKGLLNQALWKTLEPIHQSDTSTELSGDMAAQVSTVKVGVQRMSDLINKLGANIFLESLEHLNTYGERLALASLTKIPDGFYYFEDYMDDDGHGNLGLKIALTLRVDNGTIVADFTGTAKQVVGNINCPLSVAAAAVYYVFRCLMPDHTPACAGIFRHIELKAESGSLVNAIRPAAVVAGNVETSSRIVDVVLGALQQALPGIIPAASQGSMNNIAMGQNDPNEQNWDYYETLAGGMGAGPLYPGLSAVHSHMTNTLNTPVESLEMHFPIRIREYSIRGDSGGKGKHQGGNGLTRVYEFLKPTQVSLLTERRCYAPWGLAGGEAGIKGENFLNNQPIAGKTSFKVNTGDCLEINTPGGGGWGGE